MQRERQGAGATYRFRGVCDIRMQVDVSANGEPGHWYELPYNTRAISVRLAE